MFWHYEKSKHGRTWFCPSMQRCCLGDDDTVRIEFSAMGDLVQEGSGRICLKSPSIDKWRHGPTFQ